MDDDTLVLAEEPAAGGDETGPGEEGLPDVGAAITEDDGTGDDGGLSGDDGAVEDIQIGDEASGADWLAGDEWLDDGTFEWPDDSGGDASDPVIYYITIPDSEVFGRPMFEDKGEPDSTGSPADELADPAICVCFPEDVII